MTNANDLAELQLLLRECDGHILSGADATRLAAVLDDVYCRAAYLDLCIQHAETPTAIGLQSFLAAYRSVPG